jgi:hypothetical protein
LAVSLKQEARQMKTYKDIYYFPSYPAARDYAKSHGFPTDRINSFGRGWAIQWRISGPYVGPNSPYEIQEYKAAQWETKPRYIVANQRHVTRNGLSIRLAAYSTREDAQRCIDCWNRRLAKAG